MRLFLGQRSWAGGMLSGMWDESCLLQLELTWSCVYGIVRLGLGLHHTLALASHCGPSQLLLVWCVVGEQERSLVLRAHLSQLDGTRASALVLSG